MSVFSSRLPSANTHIPVVKGFLTESNPLQGNGPYLPPRAGAIRKPTAQFPSLQTVPRRPRTRPDYSKIITASCEQACCSPDGPRCRTRPVEQRPVHRRDPSLRA